VRAPRRRLALAAAVLALGLAACGGDDEDVVAETGEAPTAEAPASTTASTAATTTSTTAVGLEQPALWPAADVTFATPEEAAGDFVREVLGVEPTLGPFQQGDARSGEIALLSPGEGGGGGTAVPRGTLLLRRLGADDGWFVIAVTSDVQSIASPQAGAQVPAGPLTVQASGRGFEGTVVVSVREAGESGDPLDQVVAQGGSLAEPAPFTASLDLTGARPGEVVILLLQGGVGLETDPGDVAAIPLVIS
jgi:hypothetical protein